MKKIFYPLLFTLFSISFSVFALDEPEALELKFFDSNWNQKIDTIEIKFSETLTWSFIWWNFWIDSAAWGLSENLIKYSDSRSDLNKIWEIINWNILSIKFDEYEKTWTWLVVNPAEAWDSHLRVKSYVWIWITDLDWNEISFWLSDLIEKSSYWSFFLCEWNCVNFKFSNKIVWFENKEFKIPIIVENFSDIWGFELSFEYDKNQFICDSIESDFIENSWSLLFSSNKEEWIFNIIWDYWNDSFLNLENNQKLFNLNCLSKWEIWDSSEIILKIVEVWNSIWNWISFVSENKEGFLIQENFSVSWKILDENWENFSWAKIFLKNKNSEFDNIFEKISDSVWYFFEDLILENNYELFINIDENFEENSVDIWDVIKIQRHIVWDEFFTNWTKCLSADVNQDNKISVLDIIKLRRFLLSEEDLPSWDFKFYSEIPDCENLSSKNEKITLENFNNSVSDIIFTKIRMWNVD